VRAFIRAIARKANRNGLVVDRAVDRAYARLVERLMKLDHGPELPVAREELGQVLRGFVRDAVADESRGGRAIRFAEVGEEGLARMEASPPLASVVGDEPGRVLP
jgi:hypothetical protein